MSDVQDWLRNGGAPRYMDLPDYTVAMYTNVKNTWQDAENLDGAHGYTSYIWIPTETHSVVVMKLAVFTEKFRAYSTGAAAGGGTVVTSASGGGGTSGVSGGDVLTDTDSNYAKEAEDLVDVNPMWAIVVGGEGLLPASESGVLEAHTVGRITHKHYMGDHSHTIPDHTHDVTLPDHTHPISFGIYEEDISGRTLSAQLYDPDGNLLHDFGTILTGEGNVTLDLTSYFSTLKYGFYRVELSASGRMRVRLVFYELCRMYID